MAYRIKDRNRQIPNGYKFIQPETGWQAPRFASFRVICNSLLAHRKSRPDLAQKTKWSLDLAGVESEVEQFNVKLCLQHGWNDYLEGFNVGGAMPPKSRPPSQEESQQVSAAAGRAKKIWTGVRTLNDWIDSGDAPVDQAVANARANTCSKCLKNTAGDFTSWFTKPAAGAIQKQIERLQSRKLGTPFDPQLNVCEVCLCPLKLKVHTPISYIKANMSKDLISDLQKVEGCWIVRELKNA